MTIQSKTLALVTILLISSAMGQYKYVTVRATNPIDVRRQSATIAVQWSAVSSLLPKGSRWVTVLDSATGKKNLSQLFDSNLDGTPDELLFQSDFEPAEKKTFLIAGFDSNQQAVNSLVDVRFVEPRQDVAWENDRIAHRVYGPALAAESNNGIDVWTKRVRYLIVKKWYNGEEQTPKIVYHEDHGEGADFFNVGRSLGCGGSGIWHGGKLFQPGVFTSYKVISTGPLRACFELFYDRWNIEGKKLTEVKRITLDAGQNLDKIEVTFRGEWGGGSLEIAAGLVKRPNTSPTRNEKNSWTSLWGLTNDDVQNGYLGTGIVFDRSAYRQMTEDNDQYLMIGSITSGSTFTYYAGAGWTRSGDFKSAEDWNNYLNEFALGLHLPLTVTIEPAR